MKSPLSSRIGTGHVASTSMMLNGKRKKTVTRVTPETKNARSNPFTLFSKIPEAEANLRLVKNQKIGMNIMGNSQAFPRLSKRILAISKIAQFRKELVFDDKTRGLSRALGVSSHLWD